MTRIFDTAKLKPDCAKCDVLCCIAFMLPYPDYPKKPGEPCKNLDDTKCRCTIFNELDARGYGVCRQYDCRGTGSAVSTVFRGMDRTWITDTDPKVATAEFQTFTIAYYEILKYLYPDRMQRVLDIPADVQARLRPFVDAALDLLTIDAPDMPESE
jgi:hypothetical protein